MIYTLEQLDMMEGHEFEYAVAELLQYNGWKDVEVTQSSGDYGIDILARRMNTKYAIQCKRYSKPVGNSAVQQAAAGVDFYHCDTAAVITNNTFTKQAETMANAIGVRLWGREFLIQLIRNCNGDNDKFYTQNKFVGMEMGIAGTSKICPACRREFFSSSKICPVCNYELVSINSTDGKRAMAQKKLPTQTKSGLPAQVIPEWNTDIVESMDTVPAEMPEESIYIGNPMSERMQSNYGYEYEYRYEKSSVHTSTGINGTQSVTSSVAFRSYQNVSGTYAGRENRLTDTMPRQIRIPEPYRAPVHPEYIHPDTAIENSGWTQTDEETYNKILTTFFLCLFLGFFGVHRFYNNKIGSGILWLFTGGLFMFGWFIDLLNLVDAFIKISSTRKRSRRQHK